MNWRGALVRGTGVSLLAIVALLIAPATARAQSATATLSGSAVDPTDAMVADVAVKLIHLGTGLQRDTRTSADGTFVVPLLPPGRYRLVATHDGFRPAEVSDLVLNVSDALTIRLRLTLASVGEAVSVEADASRVSTSPAVGTVIDRQFVENLPLNGRSFQSLILLTPGVTVMGGQGQFSVNGQRTNTNYFTVDGVSANVGVRSGSFASRGLNGEYPALSASGVTTSLVSVDALEEFKLQTSTYAAEFGRQQGGQVQLVTRSGTNQLHGSAYEYLRNEALDANDWFANQAGRSKAPLRQNQFGGTLGGPVFLPRLGGGAGWWSGRDNTFFFLSHESQRLRLPTSQVVEVPSMRLREEAAPSVRTLLDAFPLPDGPEKVGEDGQLLGTSELTMVYSDPSTGDATSLRLDHVVNSALTLYGRYNRAPSGTERRFGATISRDEVNNQSATFAATMTLSPRVSHEVRFNYTRNDGLNFYGLDDYGGAVPFTGNPLVSGYTGQGNAEGLVVFGLPAYTLSVYMGDAESAHQRQYNLVSSTSLVTGGHRFKFGLDYRRLAPTFAPNDHSQQNTFSSEESIRHGVMDFVYVSSSPEVRPRFDNLSLYAQDTWQASPRLTLDFGLRWDLNPAPGDANGLEPVLVEGMRDASDLPNARLAPPGTPIYETVWTAFAPRIGAAYQLSGRSGRESVLRGGFGLYYDQGSSQAMSAFTTYPFQTNDYRNDVPYPVPADVAFQPPPPTVELPITSSLYAVNTELKLPYTVQWNVAVEQALGRSQSLTVSYVGSAARRLLINFEANKLIGGVQRPNPNFGEVSLRSNGGTADYHALQAQFQRRLSRGLQALVSYTWAHAIDLISVDLDGNAPELVPGSAEFDVRHNLSAAFTFALPGVRSRGLLGALTGGWAVDAIVHAQSGFPVDVRDGNDVIREDGSRAEYRPDRIPGVLFYLDDPDVPGGRRFNAAALGLLPLGEANRPLRRGNLGRNVFRGLPVHQVDLALQRRFRIASRVTAQIRAEAFNLFNHPNFGYYGDSPRDPASFGVPTAMMSRSLGSTSGAGLSPLYQIGGPRSMQLSLRFSF